MTVTIRRADRSDLETLVTLRLRFVADVMCVDLDTLAPASEDVARAFYQEAIPAGTHVMWLAEEDGTAVGCAAVSLVPIPPRRHLGATHDGLVLTVWVDPAHRGAGVARRLMETVVAARAELGIHRLLLKATDMAKPLYESLGFTSPPDLLELA